MDNNGHYRIWEEGFKLYHGSWVYFDKIDLSKSLPFKDFGKGFYLTTNIEQAEEWAKGKAERKGCNSAFIYLYEVDPADSIERGVISVLEHLSYSLEWLELIAKCRVYGYEPDYDIIYDRMADGDLETTIFNYLDEKVSPALALTEIRKWKKGYPRDQYCFKTETACKMLRRSSVIKFEKKKNRYWERMYEI